MKKVRDDIGCPFEATQGSVPNPDRKSIAAKRAARMVVIQNESQDRWWLDSENGMLSEDTLKALREYRLRCLSLKLSDPAQTGNKRKKKAVTKPP